MAGAPLLVSTLAGVASVAVSAASIGVLGFVGLAILMRYIPRYVPFVRN